MKKLNLFLVSLLTAMICMANAFSQSQAPSSSKSQSAKTIEWASSNVGEPNTFVANPEDYGNYYTFAEAQNVCPTGWRLPTKEELERFIGYDTQPPKQWWKTRNNISGIEYKNGGKMIFLPAAGMIMNDTLRGVNLGGAYWSSTIKERYSFPEFCMLKFELKSNYIRNMKVACYADETITGERTIKHSEYEYEVVTETKEIIIKLPVRCVAK